MNIIKVYAKTVVAFLVGVIANMIVNLVNGSSAWPQDMAQWVQFVVTSVGVALGVALTRNKITQGQLDADPHVVGGVVVDQVPPVSPPPVAPTPWPGG